MKRSLKQQQVSERLAKSQKDFWADPERRAAALKKLTAIQKVSRKRRA